MEGESQGSPTGPLEESELRALAGCFADPRPARHLLEEAGLPAQRQPPWHGSAQEFWWEVNGLLRAGVIADGRERLLAVARARYPANPAFAGGATTENRPWLAASGIRPDAGLLPTLPARFVARDDAVTAVRDLLADPSAGAVVGLVGMGGSGKSTLARAVVHDPAVRATFPDGIVWVDVSALPDTAAVVAAVLAAFGDMAPLLTVPEGSERLRRLLAGRACLVVADNVWRVDVLRALPLSGASRLLVTSRNRDALFTDSTVFEVGPVAPDTAWRVLTAYADYPESELPAEAADILAHCGGLVLALALVGGMVAEGRPWANVAERLRRADLGRLAGRFADYPHPDLLAALDAGITALPRETAERFRELAVFAGRGPVPAAVVVQLWQVTGRMDDLDADDLLRMFARRCLVQIDPRADTVGVHDLLFDYARSGLSGSRLAELHGVMADILVNRWGGLAQALPGLRDFARLDLVDQYGVGALVIHLLGTGRRDLVEQLLTIQWDTGTGGVENAWYATHESLGRTGDYLGDIRAAWADVESETDAAFTAGRGGGGIAGEITYALITGSIASIAANIPPTLLVRLVADGLWPVSRALAYALTNPDAASMAETLGGLVVEVPFDERRALVQQALGAAASIEDPYARADALGALSVRLPAEFLLHMVDAAITIEDPRRRVQVLADVAVRLTADERVLVVRRAVRSAAGIDPVPRTRALAYLARRLPAAEARPIYSQAIDSALTIDDQHAQTRVLAGLAEHLTLDLVRQTASRAASLDPPAKAAALAEVASRFPSDEHLLLLEQAVDAASAIDDPYSRTRALTVITPHLPTNLLTRAATAATTIDDPASRARALADLAECLPSTGTAPTSEVPFPPVTRLAGDQIPSRMNAAPDSENELRRAVEAAETAASAIKAPYFRAEMLGELAAQLTADERRPLLVRAVDAAAAVDDPYSRARALGAIAPYLTGDLLARAVAAAAAIDDPFSRVHALTAIALAACRSGASPAPALWRTALRSAAQVDRRSVTAVLPAVLAHDPQTLVRRARESLHQVQRWWP
ncbi:NB-ARC domain-containing protein [Frankia sp. CcI49]|uniref:NB-ARC domain-containing protein n=1 Tax=Frankia sp. CcI49 TaxID=1745382 RepID=UPI0009FF2D8F|nr:NB-ARC domain-containing protein [Frankia sp. CcI49]